MRKLWPIWQNFLTSALSQALFMEKVLWFAFVNKFCQIGHNLRIFVAFWWNIVIYALCRILVKCRDLRIFPGKKFRLPGTKNYYAALGTHIFQAWQIQFYMLVLFISLVRWGRFKAMYYLNDIENCTFHWRRKKLFQWYIK